MWGHHFKLQTVDTSIPATASVAPQLPKELTGSAWIFRSPPPAAFPAMTPAVSMFMMHLPERGLLRQAKSEAPRASASFTPVTPTDPIFNDKYNLCGMQLVLIRIEGLRRRHAALGPEVDVLPGTEATAFANFAAGAFELGHGKTLSAATYHAS